MNKLALKDIVPNNNELVREQRIESGIHFPFDPETVVDPNVDLQRVS